jgi:hypothetical protein
MKIKSIVFLMIFFPLSLLSAEFSIEKAKRIDNFLKRIRVKQKKTLFLKKITFTQHELNSYLNIFYLKRYSPEIKYMKLNLEKNNYINGTMKVKLSGEKYEKVPSFLKDIEIDFDGKIECENYRVRYIFEKMIINGTQFAPEILDEAFSAAQTNVKVKKSIFDWFYLIPGLKNVIVDYKKITLFY